MSAKNILGAFCLAAAISGCAAFDLPPEAPAQPASPGIQHITADKGYALDANGMPVFPGRAGKPEFAWMKLLRDNPAARSLVFDDLRVPAPGIDYDDFYQGIYLRY